MAEELSAEQMDAISSRIAELLNRLDMIENNMNKVLSLTDNSKSDVPKKTSISLIGEICYVCQRDLLDCPKVVIYTCKHMTCDECRIKMRAFIKCGYCRQNINFDHYHVVQK